MREVKRQAKTSIRRTLTALLAIAVLFLSPGLVNAAEKVVIEFGESVLTKADVSSSLYLTEVFPWGDGKYGGVVRGYGEYYYATSENMVDWELKSKYFYLINGNGIFMGVNLDGINYTKDGVEWKKAQLSESLTAYSLKFENGKFKLYYVESGDYINRGLMISEDGETWFDITEDKQENVDINNILVTEDKILAMSNAIDGVKGVTVSYASEINEEDTVWEDIPTLAKDGYAFRYMFFDGETVGMHMYSLTNTGENLYCLTSDYVNWEEKSWEDYYSVTGDKDYLWYDETSTEPAPVLTGDGRRLDGIECLPYKSGDEIVMASYVVFSDDGENWSRELVKISLNGELVSYTPQGETAIMDMGDFEWAVKAVEFVAGRNYMYLDYSMDGLKFNPATESTRQGFVAAIVKALKLEKPATPVEGYTPFSDVYEWGDGEYVDMARQLGLINGVGDNKFAPDLTISREDMMTITYNILKKLEKIGEDTELTALAAFADAGLVSDYAKIPVSSLVKGGIIKGDGTNIDPKKTISNAEVAVIISNISNPIKN